MKRRMTAAPLVVFVYLLKNLPASLVADQFQQGVDLGFQTVVILLRGWRADVEEVGEAHHLPQELQKLRLPVLERVPANLHQP